VRATPGGFVGELRKVQRKNWQIKHDPNHLAAERPRKRQRKRENRAVERWKTGEEIARARARRRDVGSGVLVELSSGTLRFYADSPEMSRQFRN